jgi:hypothetical protein
MLLNFHDVIFEGLSERSENLSAVRAAGRAGATRVPNTELFPADGDPTKALTDTGIYRLVDALEAGQAERQDGAK